MKYKQLTRGQRYAISVMLKQELTQKKMAELLGVSPSTISRELKRNRGKRGSYNYAQAHQRAIKNRQKSTRNRDIPEETKQHALILLTTQQFSPVQ